MNTTIPSPDLFQGHTTRAEKIVDNANKRLFDEVEDKVGEVTKEITDEVEDRVGEVTKKITDETDKFEDQIRHEIRESLLRVIEILGIFLAVVGVAATMVGGMAVGDSMEETLAIYGVGNATILVMFYFLRVIVFKASIRREKLDAKRLDKD